MKRIAVLIIGLSMFLLSSCATTTTKTCAYKNGGSYDTFKFTSKSDEIEKIKRETFQEYTSSSPKELYTDEAKKAIEDSYKKIKGAKTEVTYSDKGYKVTIAVEVDKTSKEALSLVGGPSIKQDYSLNKTIEYLEKKEYKCK